MCLLVLLLCPCLRAQNVRTVVSRQLSSISPTPNGTVDVGAATVDFRGLTVLAMSPQVIFFSQPGQTQQITIQAVATDRSSFTVDANVSSTTFSVTNPAIVTVSPGGGGHGDQ